MRWFSIERQQESFNLIFQYEVTTVAWFEANGCQSGASEDDNAEGRFRGLACFTTENKFKYCFSQVVDDSNENDEFQWVEDGGRE